MAVIAVIGGFEIVDDIERARWLIDRLDPFAVDVGSVVPRGFAAYARLFHPAFRRVHGGSSTVEVTWAQIAEAGGNVAHRMMQFPNLAGDWDGSPGPLGIFDDRPDEGSLPHDYAEKLVDVLSRFTTTPASCWFGAWEGFGASRISHDIAPTFEIPGRSMYLLHGPLAALPQSLSSIERIYQSASLCWPEDRAWCFATDIDLESTYVGGSEACVSALVDLPGLEALFCDVTDAISYEADAINPRPPGPMRL